MTRRALAVLGALLLGLVGLVAVGSPALAADHVVTLSTRGPSPSPVTVAVGDTVTFKAGDTSTYHLKSTSGAWTMTATVTRAKPFSTSAFPKPGNYDYTMTFDTLIGPSPPQDGSVVVPAPAPSPSATARPSPSATARPTARPGAVAPTATATAVPTASGVAVPPPITGGVIPTPAVTPSAGPAPQVALPGPTTSPSPSAGPHVEYADPAGIAQKSPHGMGLPTALAVVAAVGVATLLVRILLAAPEAHPDAGVR